MASIFVDSRHEGLFYLYWKINNHKNFLLKQKQKSTLSYMSYFSYLKLHLNVICVAGQYFSIPFTSNLCFWPTYFTEYSSIEYKLNFSSHLFVFVFGTNVCEYF